MHVAVYAQSDEQCHPLLLSCMQDCIGFMVLLQVQMSGEGSEDLPALLSSIVSQTHPGARHAVYHAKHLELLLQGMEKQPARYAGCFLWQAGQKAV